MLQRVQARTQSDRWLLQDRPSRVRLVAKLGTPVVPSDPFLSRKKGTLIIKELVANLKPKSVESLLYGSFSARGA